MHAYEEDFCNENHSTTFETFCNFRSSETYSREQFKEALTDLTTKPECMNLGWGRKEIQQNEINICSNYEPTNLQKQKNNLRPKLHAWKRANGFCSQVPNKKILNTALITNMFMASQSSKFSSQRKKRLSAHTAATNLSQTQFKPRHQDHQTFHTLQHSTFGFKRKEHAKLETFCNFTNRKRTSDHRRSKCDLHIY